MAEGTTVKTRTPRIKKQKCDNHPDLDAALTTDGGGAHQPIHLCQKCLAAQHRVR